MEVVYKRAETNEEIKNWVESNGGRPAIIDDPEIILDKPGLRINWEGSKDEGMLSDGRTVTKEISWEEFFSVMEQQGLAFTYSDDEETSLTWRYRFINKYESEEE